MAQLRSYREGWNYERFARYVIGKLAFIASPDTIGDDIGVDLSGFFIETSKRKPQLLMPGSAFMMQVKPPSFRRQNGDVASRYRSYVSKRIEAFTALGTPIYIGIVHSNKKQIDVYSCQGILVLLAAFGRDGLVHKVESGEISVEIGLLDSADSFPIQISSTSTYKLLLHKVTTLTANTGIDSPEMMEWATDCDAYHRTLESYIAGEFIFDGPGGQFAQFIGIGTFSHAIKRMMHASTMLAEEIHHGHRFVDRPDDSDQKFLVSLGETASYLDRLRLRLVDDSSLKEIIDSRRWDAWLKNISAIAETAAGN
jgi:hypothetical protein